MICPECLELGKLINEQTSNFSTIRTYEYDICGTFKTTEKHLEPLPNLFDVKVWGVHQRVILDLLLDDYEINRHTLLNEYKEWCKRCGRKYRRLNFSRAIKSLKAKRLIEDLGGSLACLGALGGLE